MNLPDSIPLRVDRADPETPWLGLRSFTEETQDYFFGRTEELQDFFERVLHKPLTVLFGQSGLGKTSLIQAGLIPKLRDAGLLPVRLRLRYDDKAGSPGTQMIEALGEALEVADHSDLAAKCVGATNLWLLLHDVEFGFIDKNGAALVRPVFIFDQFEEIFTLGDARHQMADEFRETLAAIVENRMPSEVRAEIETDDELAERLDYHAHPAKVLLSLREDYLHLLERWRRRLPALMDNRMELRPLSGVQAVAAVTEPGGLRAGKAPIASREVGVAIVRFVAGVRSDVPLDEIDAVPPLLSLMCAELNAQRLAAGDETISEEQLVGRTEHILEKFYSDTFANHPADVRQFVEDRLLSESGHRQAVTLDTAEAELARAGLTNEAAANAISGLVERRLLVADERGGVRRIELTHDVLTAVASASRAARRERQANARLVAEQQERMQRQRRITLLVVTMLLLGCLGLMAYAYRARQKIRFRELVDAGYQMLQFGEYSSAHSKFREASHLDPSEIEPWFGIGDALVRQTYGSGDPRNTAILTEAVEAYRRAAELEKARNSGELSIGPAKIAQAYVGMGDVYAVAEKPDFDKAAALYHKAKEVDPDSPDPAMGYGNIFLGQGKFHLAMEQYKASLEAALKRNAPNYGAHAGLGSALYALGHYRLAIDEFNRAIGANPGAIVAKFRLANALYMNDRQDPVAVELFQSLVGSTMKRVDSLSRTSLAYMLLEKSAQPSSPPEAVRYLEDAYRADPYAFSAFRFGIAKALLGDEKGAAVLWLEALQLSWGGDVLDREIYSALLRTLRHEPEGLAAWQGAMQRLEEEGAAGLLEGVSRDTELIRRSGFYEKQLGPLVTLLDGSIKKARERN